MSCFGWGWGNDSFPLPAVTVANSRRQVCSSLFWITFALPVLLCLLMNVNDGKEILPLYPKAQSPSQSLICV